MEAGKRECGIGIFFKECDPIEIKVLESEINEQQVLEIGLNQKWLIANFLLCRLWSHTDIG